MVNEQRSWIRRFDESGIPLLAVRLVLGGLFIWMGANKVGHPVDFLKEIREYHALPESPAIFLNATAIVLPWLEVVAGSALILGIFIRGAAATFALMLAVFTPAILLRALDIRAQTGTPFFDISFDCGCGAGVVVTWKKLLENSGLFLLSLYGMLSLSRRFCLEHWWDRRRPAPMLCRRCGYALRGPSAGLCPACREKVSTAPLPAPNAA